MCSRTRSRCRSPCTTWARGGNGSPRTRAPRRSPTDRCTHHRARRVAHSVTHHGVTVEDPYAWLRDPGYPQVNDPDVLGYLNAENAYFEAAMTNDELNSNIGGLRRLVA